MAGKREEQMKEITERLEQGVQELFTSEKYTEYLKTMSQFHNYSFNNTMLIAMQRPDATLVAGYALWKKKFNRQVKRGEKGIQIIAPAPIRQKEEIEKFDPETNEPILRPDGQPETEEIEHIIPRFRVATVFDISQTYGDPIPELDTPELLGSVENYPVFMEAIKNVSPVPMRYAKIEGESKGYYSNTEKEIVIRDGMSEKQTMKTAVHEVTHAMCHDRDIMEELGEKKDRMTREVEAESVAFTVCSFFGMDTSSYSFLYLAGWSSSKDMKELRSSMDFIRKTAGSFIDSMLENIRKLQKEKEAERELGEDDLVFQVALSGEDAKRFYLVDNVGRVDFLRLLQSFADQRGENRSPEQFLKKHGVHLDLWKDSENPERNENMPDFYDVLYMDADHIVDASRFSMLIQAELMISRAEYGHTALGREEHNLAVLYAYKLDNPGETKKLIEDLVKAAENPGIRDVREIMEDAQAEIDALPDNNIGLMQMHDFGYRNDSVLPLTMERAAALHHAGLHIYNLHEDGSSTLMNTERDILEAGGLFGIDAGAWESYLVMESVREENKEREIQTEDVSDESITWGKDEKDMDEENVEMEMQAETVPESGVSQEQVAEETGEEYQEVEIFGVPALFSNGRIAENEVPEGFYRYGLRGSDYDPGDPVVVENHVTVNHAGTILAVHPLPIPERGFLNLGEELNFTGGMSTPEQFRQSLTGVDFSGLEEKMQDAVIRSNEELLYTDTADRYAIFQIDEKGKGREYLFFNMDFIKKKGMEVEGGDYSLVYGGRLGQQENLDTIYEKFNINHPEGYTGHSLSVSDIVVVNRGGQVSAHFVDSFGFTELPDFMHQREQLIGKEAAQDLEEEKYPPLYTHTLTYAMEHGRADDYLDSRKLNLDCKKAVEAAIRENFDGMHLSHNAAEPVLEEYGAERVTFILANTVQHLEHDGRFSRDNKEWAKSFEIPENISRGMDLNADYVVTSHPAVLDGFIGLARDQMREQELQQETEMQINGDTRGLTADGHFGTWHTAEVQEINGELFYRMEHDEYGASVASIIVNQDGKLVAEDLEHGFDQGAREAIHEYFMEKGIADEQETAFIAQYYVIPDVHGEDSEGEFQYFPDFDAAVDAYHQVPNHKDKEIGMESTEQPPSRMPLIECRNGVETLTDIEFASLSGKWVCGETMEASQKAKDYLDNLDTELAYQTERGYFSIQTVSDGYDYTVYNENFREIDGGVYDDPNISISEAMEAVLADAGIGAAKCRAMDYGELQEKADAVAQEDLQKAQEKEPERMPLVSGRTTPETALNGRSRADVEETVLCYAQAKIDEMGLAEDVKLLGARVYGSRSREGLYHEGSDIDVVVSYSGDFREDAFFNALHGDGLTVAGIPVDVNPISTEQTGTLEEYLESADRYLDEKQKDMGTVEKAAGENAQEEPGAVITFCVAECSEFPVLGEYHERLETLQEAVELYDKIPSERMNGMKSVGFCLEDGSIYDGTFDLMVAGEIQKEFINGIPHYRESPLVQKAIAEMEGILAGRAGQHSQNPEKEMETEPLKPAISQKNERKDVHMPEADKQDAKVQEYAGKTVQTGTKAPETEKTAEKALKTDRNLSGGNKKQSVLNALRERQARLKAQEKQGQKSQAHRKGGQEL